MLKQKRFWLLLVIIAVSGCQRCQIKDVSDKKPWAEVISYAENHLPKEGILVQQSDGYAYVKVDDRYIHELFVRLNADADFQKPPYFRRPDAPGAHISVIYKDEKVKLQEVGQRISFSLNDIIIVRPTKTTSYIVLQVDAPELEKLRQKYGLKPKLKDHEFHISIAKREKK